MQPGVTMIELGGYLAARGLSIGFTHLGFRGVTVAGAIGTSARTDGLSDDPPLVDPVVRY